MLKKTLKKEGGFTLLELLIVLVIIGILALLIIPNITSAPKKARDTTRKTDLRAIQKGLEEYYTSNNNYPTVATAGDPKTVLASSLGTGTPPIIKNIPQDPKNSGTSVYSYVSADGTSYTLKACLENTSDAGQYVVSDTSCGTGGKSFTLVNNN